MIPSNRELHIYGQPAWHDNAYVVGTREGLEALANAIHKALDQPNSDTFSAFAGDGEGYRIYVITTNSESMATLVTPYTDEIAIDSRTNAVHPIRLIRASKPTEE